MTAISGYQSNALAAKLAMYTTNQSSAAAGGGDGKANGSTEAQPAADDKTGDSVILTLSAAAQQWLASQQVGTQAGQQISQPANLAAYLTAADNNQASQSGFIDAYSGAIKQFQQWISQPLQINTKPKDDHNGVKTADPKPADKTATASEPAKTDAASTTTDVSPSLAVTPTSDTAASAGTSNNNNGTA